jgi:hypothetical protein
MTILTEGRHPGEFIINEDPGTRSREAVTIASEQDFEPGTVLAKVGTIADMAATSAAGADNTGQGALTLASPAVTSKARDGVYTIVCVEPASAGGTFDVQGPDGKSIGTAKVGVAFTKEVKFTIADGDPDFAAGDRFTVTVAADQVDFTYVAYDQDGTDGSEIPDAIAIYGATTGVGETADIAAITNDAEVNGNCLVWPDDIEAAEKADAIQALNAKGIKVRA